MRARRTWLAAAVAVAPAVLTAMSSGAPAAVARVTAAATPPLINPTAARLAAGRFESEMAHRPADQVGFLGDTASRAAVAQREAIARASTAVIAAGGTWKEYGTAPVLNNTADYTPVDAIPTFTGRVADFAYDPATGRVWVAVGVSGIWVSADLGAHWRNITDSLPATSAGGVAFSTAQGGTLIDGTGDFAGGYIGLGVYRSTDGGATWTHASGVPDGFLTSKVVVDPTDPTVIYVATSRGLYRSADDGVSFTNVALPVPPTAAGGPPCAGDTTRVECAFANEVTDVVVRQGDSKDAGGEVLAAVGWERGVRYTNKGWVNSAGNGLYLSPKGLPGTFTNTNASSNGFTVQSHIGHVALGNAVGATQNHSVVYAMVQDAQSEDGYFPVVDPNPGVPAACATANCYASELDNIYESTDFGATWHAKLSPVLAGQVLGISCPVSSTDLCYLQALPAVGGVGPGGGYAPGIQSRYNEWIKPDPSLTDGSGNPTRVIFGLEELWEINYTDPQNAAGTFVVPRTIGRYFGNGYCPITAVPPAGVAVSTPVCPGQNDAPTTTHPDQHAGIFIPDGSGGVTLLAGNDGGVFGQHVNATTDFANNQWGNGLNQFLPSTLNYHLAVSGDGNVYTGLQDNGEVRIEPGGRMVEVFGGDAFYSATDPANSKVIYEEYTGGNMSVSTDGGHTWAGMNPGLTVPQFSTPFTMDPTDANHLMIGGQDVQETVSGPQTTVSNGATPAATDWKVVFDLGAGNALSAVDIRGNAAYVGFCGPCYIPSNVGSNFTSGLATNVGGPAAPAKGTTSGWHVAKAIGLPQRYIHGLLVDPYDPRTVYATLVGYAPDVEERQPGRLGDDASKVGRGHVFKSTDAGEHFTDISGNLPDVPASWVIKRGDQLIVATYAGIYLSSDLKGTSWSLLGGTSMPITRVTALQLQPFNPNRLFASTYGRGVFEYDFPSGAQIDPGQVNGTPPATPNTEGLRTDAGRVALGSTVVAVIGVAAARRRRRHGF